MDTHELADLAFKMLMTKELRDPVPEVKDSVLRVKH